VIIRILPHQRAVTANRKKISALRPSHLISRLKAIQNRRSTGNPQAFIEELFTAYKLLEQGEREGTTIPLAEILRIFTMLPGSDYSQQDFERDLLSLERSGTSFTKSGARVSFPASSGTRDAHRTFLSMTAEGETVPFYAIKFTQETD